MWGCVFSVYPLPLWWLREYMYFVLLSSSNRKYELLPIVVAEEGRDPLNFIVFILSTSLDARKGTEYDNVQKRGVVKLKGKTNKPSQERKQQSVTKPNKATTLTFCYATSQRDITRLDDVTVT